MSWLPQILHSFRQSVDPEQWERYLAGFPADIRSNLATKYGL